MYLLGIDLETSGKEPQMDRILEFGAVFYDWDKKMPMRLYSQLVDPALDSPTAPTFEVSEEITEITGITTDMVAEHGSFEYDGLSTIALMARDASYIVAHFGNDFDRLFVDAACQRSNQTPWDRPWIDTSIDIEYPARIKTRNLRHLAAEHGFLNPFSHRAVFDVLTMFEVMKNYELERIIARSLEPIDYLQAIVSFDQKDYAKGRGYRWCAEKKLWWRSFKRSDALREKDEAGFLTQYIDKPE